MDESVILAPDNPYGASKLMSETILQDTAKAHDLSYVVLRYFNVAGADPSGRSGQLSKPATHLIKVVSELVCGKRDTMQIFGTDYNTPDGTCIRDYIHISDLIGAPTTSRATTRAETNSDASEEAPRPAGLAKTDPKALDPASSKSAVRDASLEFQNISAFSVL